MLKTYQFKLTVRATVIALKLQISFCQDYDKTKVNALTAASEMVFKFIQLHYVG